MGHVKRLRKKMQSPWLPYWERVRSMLPLSWPKRAYEIRKKKNPVRKICSAGHNDNTQNFWGKGRVFSTHAYILTSPLSSDNTFSKHAEKLCKKWVVKLETLLGVRTSITRRTVICDNEKISADREKWWGRYESDFLRHDDTVPAGPLKFHRKESAISHDVSV